MSGLYGKVFTALGWKTEGQPPAGIKKYIIVVAPHTSNWDFLVGLGARSKFRFEPRYIAKKELFVGPFGWLFRKLGGYPVERKSRTNFVEQMVEIFDRAEEFILTITPEGTRKRNEHWKTGFFYIAQKANVPVVPVAFDYPTKRVIAGDPQKAEGDVEEFIKGLKKWFGVYKGRNPEQGI